ncbi:cell division protein ZipA [Billgrantia gudaonensis]|uniref:Cell division protein ZipA n=1 Tax=Billgrantia gudaonensis TaxID=376427 RepID=A0A1G8RGV6_9GAMM|nr:cell division protein ZipA [Halomonas gudaonensis]SDJ16139.1 cell division protein ZipA [Halomonas gudaonensis]
MELREWLIILGLALVTLIVVDGVRRLKRQHRVPRLDQAGTETSPGTGAASDTEGDSNWELPNGGARVVSPASSSTVKPKPKLQRQEHPGPSRVLAARRRASAEQPSRQAEKASRCVADADEVASAETPPTATEASSSPARRADEAAAAVAEPETGMPEKPVDASSADFPRAEAESAEMATSAAQDDAASTGRAQGDREPSASDESHATAPPRRREPTLSALGGPGLDDAEPSVRADSLNADPADHDESGFDEDERYRLVDLEGVGDSLKSGSRRMGASMQRFGVSVQERLAKRRERKREAREEKARLAEEREAAVRAAEEQASQQARAEREAIARRRQADEARHSAVRSDDADDPLFAPSRRGTVDEDATLAASRDEPAEDGVVRTHPTLEKALRHDVSAERARDALSHADEVIVISVMSRDEAGFAGAALLDLMLACGLRYSSEMGIFHRFETEDADSELQFSMVNVLKPGTFPIETMDDFTTPGITLLMPLPGAVDTAAAFEAMVETAMVIVRHLGGELKDENHSVMTAQTVGFARQRVQEFERRHRLNRRQVN